MLYQYTLNPSPISENRYSLSQGFLYVFEFSLLPSNKIFIIGTHLSNSVQDHSIRFWISRDIGGTAIKHYPSGLNYWHPNRVPKEIVGIQDESFPVVDKNVLASPPGTYYLNTLNLINSINVFSLTFDTQSV